MAAPYWFFSSEPSQMKGLPAILVFLVPVADWSDGTPAGKHKDSLLSKLAEESAWS
jgi:hypothetical protein